MFISGAPINWVNKFRYLGVNFVSSKRFTVDLSEVRRKFFASVNMIFSNCKYASDMVKLSLLESHCLPILLYSVEVLNLPRFQQKEMNSWWNSVYRKIFHYNKWESVKEVIYLCGRLNLLHLINLRSVLFHKRLLNNTYEYEAIHYLGEYVKCTGELYDVLFYAHVKLSMTAHSIKKEIFQHLNNEILN